jgi:isocitrate/isopropylmalate dehydrogenase
MSAAMMMRYSLGQEEIAKRIEAAVDRALPRREDEGHSD